MKDFLIKRKDSDDFEEESTELARQLQTYIAVPTKTILALFFICIN